LTSAYEGMPNALLEAMSAGLPSVATDVPGTRDVLNAAPDIGILADPEHPGRFAESLVALLLDPRRMRVIGENAREYVREHHSLEEMTRRYCEVFRAVLEKDRSGSKPERRTDACP
jgi:glycosyltransferase involved in cell wall biosynthesis